MQTIYIPTSHDVAYRCLRALQSFRPKWKLCETNKRKIELLRHMAGIYLWHRETDEHKRKVRREQFNKRKPRIAGKDCAVCGSRAECRHHIIQIQNGGTNRKQNILLLCNGCHAEVHPWLRDK